MPPDDIHVTDGRTRDVYINHELDDLGLDPYAFRIYARLSRRAGTPKGAYESVSEMARGCRMSPRRVHQALRELEQLHLVRKVERSGQTSVFRLTDKSEWATPAPRAEVPTPARDADPPLHQMQTTSAPRADKGEQGKASKGRNTTPPHPPTPEPDPKTEIEDDDFDPQALKRLQDQDRQLHKRIETRAGSLGWQFRHKVLLAMRALADPDRTLAALQATIEGADGKGAKAWRYFAACYENHGQQKPSAEGDIDDLLRRYMHAEGVIDGEPFTVIAAGPDGKTLVTDGAGYLTPQQVEEGMRCART